MTESWTSDWYAANQPSWEQTVESRLKVITESFSTLGEAMLKLTDQLEAVTGYLTEIRKVISLPPMFPLSPSDGDSFYDELTGYRYYWSEDEDFPEDSKWVKYYD